MTPLILDVDTGIDDAFGLLYALAAPEARLIGVSAVAGNVSLAKAARNTRAVLALARRADLPVWEGAAAPLLGHIEDASDIHGATGLGHAVLPEPAPAPPGPHAIDALIAASREHEGDLILVATGPLTNIALAIARDPGFPRRLKRFVAMGGAFTGGGNTTAAAEFNIWYDPEAARMVVSAFAAADAAPAILVGLDVTRQTVLTEADLKGLAKTCASAPNGPPLTTFLRDAARHYFELMAARGRPRALAMHDPLAVAAALDPSLVTTKALPVDIETRGELTRGQTVADFRGLPGRIGVALEVEAQRFRADYLAAIERLAQRL
ncbi:MAG TPA: nucleoside hydrolase [Roseiarcus sp.]|nr:nucleoside hydrolase [Roseiarcus sp.]